MTDAPPGGLRPLALYVHWPYCARVCPYCDFNVVRDRGRRQEQAQLASAIVADIAAHARLTGPMRLTSIFFGGGTPSLMAPVWAAEIIAAARAAWTSDEALEISLEANPTDAEAGRFAGLRAAGVQRLSLGVQALDDASLSFLGRNHGADEAIRAARLAAALFPRLSLDLIYALPGQTPEAWTETLARAADELGPEHLSAYQLTIEPGTAFHRAVGRGRFTPVDAELAAQLYEATQAVLERRGFDAYEVSNHARGAGARSRHNLAYWRGWAYAGVGPGAHGRLDLDGGRTATAAAPGIADYLAAVERTGLGWGGAGEVLTSQAVAEERLMMGLRTEEGAPWSALAALSLTPSHPRVQALAEAGLVAPGAEALRATRAGRLVLNAVLERLMV